MCGIAGVLMSPERDTSGMGRAVTAMTDRLRHRGPDDSGRWVDAAKGIALGHRRLSIVDLSPNGAQPMRSRSGQLTLVLNGEIYNHAELRRDLKASGEVFRGHSDTEVLLAAIERHGLMEALRRSSGMFALALWNATSRSLFLARDRVGEKPLYCGLSGGAFLFASEARAFHGWPGFEARVDRTALAAYLRHLCVPAELCIFEGFWKVAPATVHEIRVVSGKVEVGAPTRYWDMESVAARALVQRTTLGQQEAEARFIETLSKAAGRCAVSDVPTGAFLSGGVDSTAIVACLTGASSRAPLTFSMGVTDEKLDEAPRARAIAAVLGTRHQEEYVTEADAIRVVPELGEVYDEPFADSSQIPTLLVSRLARRHVTVVLAGDGGDELLGGYPKYRLLPSRWDVLGRIPPFIRRPAHRGISALARTIPPGETRFRLEKAEGVLEAGSLLDYADHSMSQWRFPERIVPGARRARRWSAPPLSSDPARALMLNDLRTYFVDDLLVKVDRASMSTSLEVRLPFLDPEVIQAAWSLPSVGEAPGPTKIALRRFLEKHLPADLVHGPKKGFSVPLGRWLTGPLREWAKDLLFDSRLVRDGYLVGDAVAREWAALDHRPGHAHRLWTLIGAESWYRALGKARQPVPPPGSLVEKASTA